MTTISLDFSRRRELGLHAQVVADIGAATWPLGITPLIVGAFARDLHLLHGQAVATLRQTEDIDFALAVPDWAAFDALRKQLIDGGSFTGASTPAHRLRHRNGLPVDLVPFDGVETRDRTVAWPPRGEVVMNTLGFREALASACEVMLPGGVLARVAALQALALLKIICWRDRHYAWPRKDALDLILIVKNYLSAGNEPRLFDAFVEWTQEDSFDYELAGARMLGYDIRGLLDGASTETVAGLLTEQADARTPARLPAEMAPGDPDRARALLAAMARGMRERRLTT